MFNFSFHNPTKILFGQGQIAAITSEIPAGAKVMVVYGGGSIRFNGVLTQVQQALAGYKVTEFGGVEANPTYETLMQAVALAKSESIDFLLAVGGGSVIDGTKFIAAAVKYAGADPWDILANGAAVTAALPFGSVLTLPATGSEMNSGSVVTRKSLNAKLFFGSPLVYPAFSVLDPTTTYTLPPRQIGNGVVDSFVHVMEQYLTYPAYAAVQDRFAEGLLLTLIDQGPLALLEPEDYDVRANLMWCSTMALNGLIGCGVPQDWATHMVGHEITALHGLDHAQTLAIVLPSMLQARRDQKHGKLLQYAERVWGIREGDEEQRIDQAIANTRDFFERMQVKTRLSDYGVGADAIPALVASLSSHGFVKLGEHGDVTPERVMQILQMSL